MITDEPSEDNDLRRFRFPSSRLPRFSVLTIDRSVLSCSVPGLVTGFVFRPGILPQFESSEIQRADFVGRSLEDTHYPQSLSIGPVFSGYGFELAGNLQIAGSGSAEGIVVARGLWSRGGSPENIVVARGGIGRRFRRRVGGGV